MGLDIIDKMSWDELSEVLKLSKLGSDVLAPESKAVNQNAAL